ncbi:MAG: hypothetical protein ABL986_17315 [Vicinamibacterales bacterium]
MDAHVNVRENQQAQIAIAAGAALLIAGLLLVMVVLPAEYGVDPLGTGARLGLTRLAETGEQVDALNAAAATPTTGQGTIIVAQARRFQQETVAFTLGPKEGMEYKYRLDKGQALLYAWTASVPVAYEAHAEPDGAPRGYAQSYEKGADRASAAGTLTAPFAGIHGWYWENPSDTPITVTLSTAGYYTLSHEFRTGAPTRNKTFQ